MDFDVAVNPFTTILGKTLKGDCAIHDFRYSGNESSITGVASGDFRLEFDDAGLPREGFFKFDMQNVLLKGLNIKGFNIPAVQFASIKADSVIKNNELKINSVVFTGADLNGTMTGTVLLSQFLGNSTMNLQIEIDPASRLVNDYRILLGNIGKEGGNKIRISISGTLQDPKADLPRGQPRTGDRPVKIELSRYSGFCMGVRDAVLKIVRELNKTHDKILVYGSLIHNPQTVEILGQRGLSTIRTLDDIDGKLVAIRTHGVPVELLREIRSRSRRYINLTCPRVSRVQGLIKGHSAKGYFTIIIGDADHAEVMGLKSYATSGVMVIQGADAISSIPPAPRYIVVSQTTQDIGKFNDVADALRKRFPDIKIFNTICDSTCNRQNDILAGIEKGIDALVVVGGKESANTLRLAGMGREHKLKTFHIETEAELGEGDFSQVDHVLVTAGASTPGWIINNVMERLHEIERKKQRHRCQMGL